MQSLPTLPTLVVSFADRPFDGISLPGPYTDIESQCNGLKPCVTCAKRNHSCTYGAEESGTDERSHSPNPTNPKRRQIEPVSNGLSMIGIDRPISSPITTLANGESRGFDQTETPVPGPMDGTPRLGLYSGLEHDQKPIIKTDGGLAKESHTSNADENEEAVVYSNTRMLQDPTGRLCKCRELPLPFVYGIGGSNAVLGFAKLLSSLQSPLDEAHL